MSRLDNEEKPAASEGQSGAPQMPSVEPTNRDPIDLGVDSQEEVERIVRRAVEVLQFESFAGPLPHPDTLRQYAELYPRAPQIIFDSFERQGDHRRELESFAIRHESRRSFAGLICGFIIMLTIIGLAFYAVSRSYQVAGTILALSGLAGLAAVFVVGSERRRRERIQKAQLMAHDDDERLQRRDPGENP